MEQHRALAKIDGSTLGQCKCEADSSGIRDYKVRRDPLLACDAAAQSAERPLASYLRFGVPDVKPLASQAIPHVTRWRREHPTHAFPSEGTVS
jgi:hypothetical protein